MIFGELTPEEIEVFKAKKAEKERKKKFNEELRIRRELE